MTCNTDAGKGLEGEQNALVIRDVWSRLLHAYPVPDKSYAYVVKSLQGFVGKRKVAILFTDGAAEFDAAARHFNWAQDFSQPDVPHTNAIAERGNQLVKGGAIACLIEAGLPPSFWT